MNRVFLMGHLGAAPELKESKGGRAYARLRVATHRRWTDADDQSQEQTDWHSVFVWGPLAQTCVTYLQKGSRVFIEGSLTYWTVPEAATSAYKNAIHGHEVHFLSSPRTAQSLSSGENIDIPGDPGNHNAVAHL